MARWAADAHAEAVAKELGLAYHEAKPKGWAARPDPGRRTVEYVVCPKCFVQVPVGVECHGCGQVAS